MTLAATAEPPFSVVTVDPGTARSAWCILEGGRVVEIGTDDNALVRGVLATSHSAAAQLIIEDIESFGMPVGREVFRTAMWCGRFHDAWRGAITPRLLPRRTVKLTLCGTAKAKDPHIRQVVIDRLGEPPTKAKPNLAYPRRPSAHEWSAIALALTFVQLRREGTDGELETLEG